MLFGRRPACTAWIHMKPINRHTRGMSTRVCLLIGLARLWPQQENGSLKRIAGAHTAKTKPAGEGCRARGRRSRLQMMPKWCPGPAPCRLAGGTAPMVTLGADGAVGRERRESDQPLITLMSELLTQRACLAEKAKLNTYFSFPRRR